MFRIEYLKLKGHPQLGDIDLLLSEANEIKNVIKPYTSVIIGPNGTGKSFILRTIAEIFRQFKEFSRTDQKEFNLPFDIHLRYQYYHNTYEIVTRKLKVLDKNKRREYLFYKNRPEEKIFFDSKGFEIITGFESLSNELEYPEKVLVNSILHTDRFVYKDTKPDDFYQYLGARSTSSSTSTKSSVKRTIKHLFNASNESIDFDGSLKELLIFLGFEESFKVEYTTKINKLFFANTLKVEDFKKYFEEWWDEKFTFTNRKKENPLWSIPYYNNNFKENESLTVELVAYLNKISADNRYLQHKAKSSSKILSIDLFSNNISAYDLKMIGHLENLDIINLNGIKVQKSISNLSINEISSGEYHLLISLIGMFANISDNSLILIDEPEISLHPNWQMKYVSFLKKVFSKFSSCHFILTTHSHFLVSDLEGDSSSVTALSRNNENGQLGAKLLEGQDTFGWSAEEVLYNVFKLKTVRNYYLEADLTDLLGLISENSKEKTQIEKLLETIKAIDISSNDPLNAVIEEANAYLKTI
ncbi:MAG: hypothetical protein K0S44_299 [Bacteroidetes bacterium]|jgi:predicted ATP-binding protein involved in virulence|nr:hypothetical protein [Bacteroidota bacterium]